MAVYATNQVAYSPACLSCLIKAHLDLKQVDWRPYGRLISTDLQVAQRYSAVKLTVLDGEGKSAHAIQTMARLLNGDKFCVSQRIVTEWAEMLGLEDFQEDALYRLNQINFTRPSATCSKSCIQQHLPQS